MNSITRLVAMVAGLVLVLHVTPSWGQLVNGNGSDTNQNTAGGTGALAVVFPGPTCGVTGGCGNTAFGFDALQNTTTGNANTATGDFALMANGTGTNNTATGAAALVLNSTGTNNTATGEAALNFNTTGSDNTASGVQALATNSTGNSNTAVGFKALKKSTGSKNIAIGYQAGVTLATGNNNIYIGNAGNGDEFQTIRIGTAQTSAFMAGITTGGVGNNAGTVMIDTNTGQLGLLVSSARYKRDIAPMGAQSQKVFSLRPVTFAYKEDAAGMTHYGLVAEEVAAVYPELVTRTATGEVQTVKYHELIPMLLNELQRQRQAFQQESAEVAMLRKELADLRTLVSQGRETASLSR